MLAAHVFMGAGYYPQSGLGDYEKSFYGDYAVDEAEEYALETFPGSYNDWWVILVDRGEGLRTHAEHWGAKT